MYRHTIVCLVMYRDTIHDKKQNNNVVIYVLFKSVRPVSFCPCWFVPLLYGKVMPDWLFIALFVS